MNTKTPKTPKTTKTTHRVINNLKEKIVDRKLQLTDLYTQMFYKNAIKHTVDEKIGVEPNRDLLRYVEGNQNKYK